MLLVSRHEPPPLTQAAITDLHARFGGTVVSPLHITCDRFSAAGDLKILYGELERAAIASREIPIIATGLFSFRPLENGSAVLKYRVAETDRVARARRAVRNGAAAAGMVSAYGGDTEYTVTLLRDTREEIVPPPVDAFEAFVADRFLVSRIAGLDRFETLREIDFGSRH